MMMMRAAVRARLTQDCVTSLSVTIFLIMKILFYR